MCKVRPHEEFLAEIKEEVIEYNRQQGIIIRYAAIMERAQNDLKKILNIW